MKRLLLSIFALICILNSSTVFWEWLIDDEWKEASLPFSTNTLCTGEKEINDVKYWSYKRSDCFKKDNKYYYYICDKLSDSCDIPEFTAELSRKIDAQVKQFEQYDITKLKVALTELDEKATSKRYKDNASIVKIIDYLKEEVNRIIDEKVENADYDDFFCQLGDNCEEEVSCPIYTAVMPKAWCDYTYEKDSKWCEIRTEVCETTQVDFPWVCGSLHETTLKNTPNKEDKWLCSWWKLNSFSEDAAWYSWTCVWSDQEKVYCSAKMEEKDEETDSSSESVKVWSYAVNTFNQSICVTPNKDTWKCSCPSWSKSVSSVWTQAVSYYNCMSTVDDNSNVIDDSSNTCKLNRWSFVHDRYLYYTYWEWDYCRTRLQTHSADLTTKIANGLMEYKTFPEGMTDKWICWYWLAKWNYKIGSNSVTWIYSNGTGYYCITSEAASNAKTIYTIPGTMVWWKMCWDEPRIANSCEGGELYVGSSMPVSKPSDDDSSSESVKVWSYAVNTFNQSICVTPNEDTWKCSCPSWSKSVSSVWTQAVSYYNCMSTVDDNSDVIGDENIEEESVKVWSYWVNTFNQSICVTPNKDTWKCSCPSWSKSVSSVWTQAVSYYNCMSTVDDNSDVIGDDNIEEESVKVWSYGVNTFNQSICVTPNEDTWKCSCPSWSKSVSSVWTQAVSYYNCMSTVDDNSDVIGDDNIEEESVKVWSYWVNTFNQSICVTPNKDTWKCSCPSWSKSVSSVWTQAVSYYNCMSTVEVMPVEMDSCKIKDGNVDLSLYGCNRWDFDTLFRRSDKACFAWSPTAPLKWSWITNGDSYSYGWGTQVSAQTLECDEWAFYKSDKNVVTDWIWNWGENEGEITNGWYAQDYAWSCVTVNPLTWSCSCQSWSTSRSTVGLNNGESNYVCVEKVEKIIYWTCGSRDWTTISSVLTSNSSNLCKTWTPTEPWIYWWKTHWNCSNVWNTKYASCSAEPKTIVNGVCWSVNGLSISKKPTYNLCKTGTVSWFTYVRYNTYRKADEYAWKCSGNDFWMGSHFCRSYVQDEKEIYEKWVYKLKWGTWIFYSNGDNAYCWYKNHPSYLDLTSEDQRNAMLEYDNHPGWMKDDWEC